MDKHKQIGVFSASGGSDVEACLGGVSVQIGRDFVGNGDAAALTRLYERASLFNLLGTALLAAASLALSMLAATALILVPPDRASLVPWVAAPAAIAALGLGGFALFRMTASHSGITLAAAADPNASP